MSAIVARIRHQFSAARPANRAGLILLALAAFSVVGTSAWAFWTTFGSGSASATTGTLNPPTNVVAGNTPVSTTVHVSWTSPTSGVAPTGYYVTPSSGTATSSTCGTVLLPISDMSCDYTAITTAGAFTYTVTAVFHSWTATSSASNSVTVVTDTTPPVVTVTSVNGVVRLFPYSTNTIASSIGGTCGTVTGDSITITPLIDGLATVPSTATCTTGSWALPLTSALATQGGHTLSATQTDTAGNIGTAPSQSLTIDTLAPLVTDVTSPSVNGVYKAGVVVPVTVTFSEAVTVTGTPQLTLSTGSPATTAVSYSSGSGTSTLTFNYTVVAGNTSADLDYQATTSLGLSSGTIRDAATNNATLTLASPAAANSLGANKDLVIDTTAPTVTGVSSTLANGSYTVGQVIPVTVTFNEPVTVSGTPQLALSTLAPATTAVSYTSGSGTSTLTFNYTVVAGNTSADLDYQATTSLGLSSGTIRDAATNNATLTLASPAAANSLGANKDLVIDTTAPAAPSAPALAATSDSGPSNSDRITNNTTPTFTGTAEAGVTVTLFDGATPVGSAVAATGSYSITSSALTPDAVKTMTAKATDVAGNQGPSSVSTTVTIDTTAPAAPTSVTLSNGGGTGNAYINTANAAALSYSVAWTSGADATDTIKVSLASNAGGTPALGSAARGSTGTSTSLTGINATGLNDGTVTATATATDVAGNTSGNTTATNTKDVVAPAVPTSVAYTENKGSEADQITGLAEANSIVTAVESAPALNTFTVAAPALGSFDLAVQAINGNKGQPTPYSYSVTARDAAGNISPAFVVTGNDIT